MGRHCSGTAAERSRPTTLDPWLWRRGCRPRGWGTPRGLRVISASWRRLRPVCRRQKTLERRVGTDSDLLVGEWLACDCAEKPLRSLLAHLENRERDRGQRDRQMRRKWPVVEADDRNLVRYANGELRKPQDRAGGKLVALAQDRVRRLVLFDQLLSQQEPRVLVPVIRDPDQGGAGVRRGWRALV